MAMTYNSLLAPKGTSGSILNWVGYGKIDTPVILDEAQFLLFEVLRVREMRTQYVFGLGVGQSNAPLPSKFLDPIGKITDNLGGSYEQKIETDIKNRRYFQAVSGGTLGTDPFTTGPALSQLVNVNIPSHGLTQGSDVTFPNAPTLDNIPLTGTFPVTAIVDSNNVTIFSSEAAAITGGVNGGGVGVTWSANMLVAGSPSIWSIFDEAIQFDSACDTAIQCRLLYYARPKLLSANYPTNFLTDRYPKLLRVACLASAAEYMKDDGEYTKQVGALNNLISTTAASDDLSYRGASFGTDTPYGR